MQGSADPNRQVYLRIVESQQHLDGRFRNIRRVGQSGGTGSFSLVFSADDSQSGRRVAIKIFDPAQAQTPDPYRFQCFSREATTIASLVGQPDIAQWVAPLSEFTHQARTAVGPLTLRFHYYALELAQTDIGAISNQGAWDVEKILAAFHVMCRSVRRIHTRSIAHRDLRPENFLVMEDGRVVLGDFGAARNFSSGTRPLLPDYAQFWPGNYGYISPEVLAGLHGDKPTLAYGADMFALGAIFFEMLTGTMLLPLVFDVTTLAHLQAIGVVQDGKKRQDVYHGIVTALRDGHQLPSVRDVSDDIPKCIRARVDDLCGALVAIDYRERLQDFESLFRRIAVCRLLLKNDKVTQQQLGWRRQRRRALAESGAGAKK